MAQDQFRVNLTEGSVAKQLIRFSFPFLLSNLLQALYSMADMLIVGWYVGQRGISGVYIGGQITWMVTCIISGITVGSTVLIAQYQGADRSQDMKAVVRTTLTFAVIASFVLMLVMFACTPMVLRLLNTPADAYPQAFNYTYICMAGTIFVFGYNAVSAILRGMGDSRRPLYFIAIACVTNILLDLLLVAVFHMEASGAALATIASQGVSLALSILYLRSRNFMFDFHPKSFRIDGDKLRRLIKIGLPLSVQNTLVTVSFMFITSLINSFGLAAGSGLGIVGKFNSFAMLPAMALSMSIAAITGQNVGAKAFDRAKRSLWVGIGLSAAYAAVIFAWAQLLPGSIIGIFNTDADVVAAGTLYIRSFSFDFLCVAFVFCINGFINGAGHTSFSLMNGLLSSVLVRVPLAYLLARTADLGIAGIGLAAPIASLVSLCIGLVYVRSGRWKTAKILD